MVPLPASRPTAQRTADPGHRGRVGAHRRGPAQPTRPPRRLTRGWPSRPASGKLARCIRLGPAISASCCSSPWHWLRKVVPGNGGGSERDPTAETRPMRRRPSATAPSRSPGHQFIVDACGSLLILRGGQRRGSSPEGSTQDGDHLPVTHERDDQQMMRKWGWNNGPLLGLLGRHGPRTAPSTGVPRPRSAAGSTSTSRRGIHVVLDLHQDLYSLEDQRQRRSRLGRRHQGAGGPGHRRRRPVVRPRAPTRALPDRLPVLLEPGGGQARLQGRLPRSRRPPRRTLRRASGDHRLRHHCSTRPSPTGTLNATLEAAGRMPRPGSSTNRT